jgi:WD40 repeat protein
MTLQASGDFSLPTPVPRFKHPVSCRAAALPRDGSILVGLDAEGSIVGWDVRTAKTLYVRLVVTKQDALQRLTCSPDGRYVALSSRHPLFSLVRVLRIATGEEVRRFDHGFSPTFSPDGEILACTDGNTLRRWAMKSGAELPTLASVDGEFKWAAFSPVGTVLAASEGGSGLVRIWDGGTLRRTITGNSPATALAFSPDGKTLAIGTHWGLRFVDVAGGPDPSLEAHEEYATGPLTFSADGRGMVALSRQRRLLAWGLSSGSPSFTWSAFNTPDGLLEVSDRGDRAIWFDRGGLRLERIPESLGGKEAGHVVKKVSFTADGLAMTADDQGKVRFWDPAIQKEVKELTVPGRGINLISRHGRWVIYGGGADAILIWDVSSGKEIINVPARPHIGAVALSPDETTLVLGQADGSLSLWDIASRKERSRIRLELAGVTAVCWSPDGKTLAWGDGLGTVVIAGATGRDPLQFKPRGEAAIRDLDFLKDGKTLLVCNAQGVCWNYRDDPTFEPVPVERGELQERRAVPDRRWIASGFLQRGATLGYTSELFSPDGRYAITGTQWGAALIWEAPGGK